MEPFQYLTFLVVLLYIAGNTSPTAESKAVAYGVAVLVSISIAFL